MSPLLFLLSLIPLTLVLRKAKAGYDLGGESGVTNLLLFMDNLKLYGKNKRQKETLVHTVRIVSGDMRMEFGISKCALLVMKRGRLTSCDGIVLPDSKRMRSLSEGGDGYKYLGVLEADDIRHMEMKETVQKEYFRRIRKILKSKLNGSNIIQARNSMAASLVRYGSGLIDWNKDEER